ncbi:MAG: hypothetical protein ACXU9U_02025 [Parachlamydiaceae bacterium]
MTTENVELESDKIIDLVFPEVSETIDVEDWQEGEDEKLRFDIHEMAKLKQPWYIRLLSACAFVVLAAASLILFCCFSVVSVIGVARYAVGMGNGKQSIVWWWRLFCRSLVLTLTALVGIFNVQFALTILAVYFSLFDFSSSIMEKLSNPHN